MVLVVTHNKVKGKIYKFERIVVLRMREEKKRFITGRTKCKRHRIINKNNSEKATCQKIKSFKSGSLVMYKD